MWIDVTFPWRLSSISIIYLISGRISDIRPKIKFNIQFLLDNPSTTWNGHPVPGYPANLLSVASLLLLLSDLESQSKVIMRKGAYTRGRLTSEQIRQYCPWKSFMHVEAHTASASTSEPWKVWIFKWNHGLAPCFGISNTHLANRVEIRLQVIVWDLD